MSKLLFLTLWSLVCSLCVARIDMQTYNSLRKDIVDLIKEKNCAPILVRLAWHDAGTYDKESQTGGPRAAMRFDTGESTHGANAGLQIARELLQPLAKKYCSTNTEQIKSTNKISIADLWSFAGTVAIEYSSNINDSNNPLIQIDYRFGRNDAKTAQDSAPEGRLPDGDKGFSHLQSVFGKMPFTDKEIVTLSGAHTLGSCHSDRSGFNGKWTQNSLAFDNQYYIDLVNKKWIEGTNKDTGLPQYHTPIDDGTMMLRTDLALLETDQLKNYVFEYAKDQSKFFDDFKIVWKKLIELGYKDDTLYSVKSQAKSEL